MSGVPLPRFMQDDRTLIFLHKVHVKTRLRHYIYIYFVHEFISRLQGRVEAHASVNCLHFRVFTFKKRVIFLLGFLKPLSRYS